MRLRPGVEHHLVSGLQGFLIVDSPDLHHHGERDTNRAPAENQNRTLAGPWLQLRTALDQLPHRPGLSEPDPVTLLLSWLGLVNYEDAVFARRWRGELIVIVRENGRRTVCATRDGCTERKQQEAASRGEPEHRVELAHDSTSPKAANT